MARPRSEDKRNAILAAATEVVADQGPGAATAKIAKLAGVAEGSLFTYFDTKDDLLNQLYLALKADLRDEMMASYPKAGTLKNRTRHVWDRYVAWGIACPAKRKAMAQLSVSDRISQQSRLAGMEAFSDVNAMLRESIARGVMRDHPPAFVAAIMVSLAETTMDFMVQHPGQADRYRNSGFEAFWNAIVKAT